jgi:RimJ/RimL family protein N-acetyltransferase
MEKAGMTYEGRFDDLKMYSILRGDWNPRF